jgi:hypothetical protein
MSHPQRHRLGGHFLEPKTLHFESLRVVKARRKIESAKGLLGTWRDGTWRDVARWLGDEHKAGACCRLLTDDDFRPSIALIATIEKQPLPGYRYEAHDCPACGSVILTAEHIATRIVRRASHQADIRPRLPRDPALRIAKLQALLRQAEAELQERPHDPHPYHRRRAGPAVLLHLDGRRKP